MSYFRQDLSLTSGAVVMMVLKLGWLGSGLVIALVLIGGLIFAFFVRKEESIQVAK